MNRLSTHDGHAAAGVARKSGLVKGFLAVAMVLVAGCAAISTEPPQEVVKERAQARWDALVKGDFKAAYAYLSPGSRAVESEANYVASLGRGFWKSARVGKVECRNDVACDVDVTIEYQFQGHTTRTPLRESWVREGSQWWYLKK